MLFMTFMHVTERTRCWKYILKWLVRDYSIYQYPINRNAIKKTMQHYSRKILWHVSWIFFEGKKSHAINLNVCRLKKIFRF